MKRLMLLCGLVALLAVPAASADTSGSASALNPLSFTVTSTGGTFTVSAAYSVQKNQGATLEVFSQPSDDAVCRADASGSGTLTCVVTDAAAGVYRVAFWPTKGKAAQVTVTVTGSAS